MSLTVLRPSALFSPMGQLSLQMVRKCSRMETVCPISRPYPDRLLHRSGRPTRPQYPANQTDQTGCLPPSRPFAKTSVIYTYSGNRSEDGAHITNAILKEEYMNRHCVINLK